MAVYVELVYGVLYLLYTTFTFVFQECYGFSAANIGLVYIGSGIGMLLGLFRIGGASNRLLTSKANKHGGELKPEYRLLPLMFRGVAGAGGVVHLCMAGKPERPWPWTLLTRCEGQCTIESSGRSLCSAYCSSGLESLLP